MGNLFSKKLKELRSLKKISQADLADALGLARVTVSHLENSRQEPNLELLENLADFFGVSIDDLIGYIPQSAPKKSYAEYQVGKLLDEIAIQTFTPTELDEFAQVVRVVAKGIKSK